MKVPVLLFCIGLVFVLVQATVLSLLTWDPIFPDFVMILCVYWALYRPTVGAVWGTFVLGCAIDILSSPFLGINAFALSLVFLLILPSSRYVWLRGYFMSAVLVFVATWVRLGAMAAVSPLFNGLQVPWSVALHSVIWEAFSSALVAPAVFAVLRWMQGRLDAGRAPAPYLNAAS